ncbi:MAG: hypothetical protein M5U28_14755 [Sandaracinaceae bacterium]|nr:hypothetical protein [Sandaracinaceae bacterium]
MVAKTIWKRRPIAISGIGVNAPNAPVREHPLRVAAARTPQREDGPERGLEAAEHVLAVDLEVAAHDERLDLRLEEPRVPHPEHGLSERSTPRRRPGRRRRRS